MQKLALLPLVFAAGCASLTPTKEQVEGFNIYDIQTAYSSTLTMQLAGNLKQAMQENAKDVQFNNALPPATLPETAPRFQVVNPFKDATGIMAMAGNSIKIPKCEGAVIEATSHDDFAGAESTTFFVCLMPYQKGYHMDVYYSFTKLSGGLSNQALGRALTESVMGDSSQFIPRTIAALENAIKSGGVQPTLVDQYPN